MSRPLPHPKPGLIFSLGIYAGVAALVTFSVVVTFATRPWEWGREVPFAMAMGGYGVALAAILSISTFKVWRLTPDALRWARLGLLGAAPLMLMFTLAGLFAFASISASAANVIVALGFLALGAGGAVPLAGILRRNDLEFSGWEQAETDIVDGVILEPAVGLDVSSDQASDIHSEAVGARQWADQGK